VLPAPKFAFAVTGLPLFVVGPLAVTVPGMNVAPLIVYVVERLTKLWIVTMPPSALLGSVADPPGNVIWKIAPLATSAGASSENVTFCGWFPTGLVQSTVALNVPSTASAGRALAKLINAATMIRRPPYAAKRLRLLIRTFIPPKPVPCVRAWTEKARK
jgi:hypothetical protein